MSFISEHFPTSMSADLFNLVAGEQLGSGISRRVHVYRFDRKAVIKFEQDGHRFQNITEWTFWLACQDHGAMRRWFAPCVEISACGRVLLQRRTHPIPPHVSMPTRVPSVLRDVKRGNWGFLDGRVVCHDYGHLRLPGSLTVLAPWRQETSS